MNSKLRQLLGIAAVYLLSLHWAHLEQKQPCLQHDKDFFICIANLSYSGPLSCVVNYSWVRITRRSTSLSHPRPSRLFTVAPEVAANPLPCQFWTMPSSHVIADFTAEAGQAWCKPLSEPQPRCPCLCGDVDVDCVSATEISERARVVGELMSGEKEREREREREKLLRLWILVASRTGYSYSGGSQVTLADGEACTQSTRRTHTD